MSNQNPQATNVTTVDEAQKSQVASQNCSQVNISEGNFAPNINIENFQQVTLTSGQEKTKSSATQNQSLIRRIANYFVGEATSSTRQNPTKIKDLTLNLQRKLQQFYQDAILPCVTWLDTGEDLIMSNYYTELQLDSSKTTITINQIFDKIDKKEPKRILIEGQPGYGKTTLATKLIYDWAVHEKYIKHFKLAFLLPLRGLRKQNIEQAMTDIAVCSGFKNNECINHIIQQQVSCILLILDGLDELTQNDRIPILKILYKQHYSTMTVIVTCRTGLFTIKGDEQNQLFGGFAKKKEFYDKQLQVLGIQNEKRKNFLLKFIPNENAERIITQIEKLTEPVKEMFKSPLFLILLAFIASNKSDITALTTKTNLFKRLFNCIINRSLKTQEINEYDLFHLDSTLNKTQKTIQQYGKQALDQLVNDKMQFECNELTKEIYQLGFLIKNKQISGLHSNNHYEAFHHSVLEFAAAFSLWINLKQSPSSANAFQNIQSVYPQLDKTSLVVPFLIGLLQDEACHFFNQFTSHAHFFSANEEIFWNVLAECPTNSMWNKLLPSIIPFIPAFLFKVGLELANVQLQDFYENLIHVGIKNNRIGWMYVSDAYTISSIPKNVIVPELWLNARKYDEKLIESLKRIQCKNFNLAIEDDYDGDLNILNLFSLTFAQSYSFYLTDDGNFSKLMYQHIDDDFVKQIQLTCLCIKQYNPILKDLISILLLRNQVQYLRMPINGYLMQLSEYNEIISAASISSYLHSLHLEWGHSDKELAIDLFDLTQGGKKKYNLLSLKNCQIVSKYEIQDKNCFHSISIYNCEELQSKQCVEGLNAIEPEVLQCNLSVFQQLSQSWLGYASINELILFLEENSFEIIENWTFLSNCKNIKTLTLQFLDDYEFSVASVATMNEILKYMQQLPIEQFGIISYQPHSVEEKLCQCVAKSLPWMKAHPLETVNFTRLEWEDGDDEINYSTTSDFLKCLKLGYLKTINFLCDSNSFWKLLMRSNIIDHSLFQITHSFTDRDEQYVCFDKFSIKLKEQND